MNSKRFAILAADLSSRPWFNYLLLFLITLLAAALRFYKLGAWSFWIDEIYTVNRAVAHYSTPELFIAHIPPARNWFPLSVIATAQVVNLWGINEFNARLIAAVVGVLTVPALYFLVKKYFNARVALITVLLLAVSPWHIDWSQNARGYTTLMLLYTLALFAFHTALEKDRSSYILLFFVLLYLASSERLIALLILPVLAVYWLAIKLLRIKLPTGLRARNLYIFSSPVLLLGVVELYSIIQFGNSIIGSIVTEIIDTFVGKPIEGAFTQTIFLAFKLGLPLLVMSMFSAFFIWSQKNRSMLLMTVGAIMPVAIVIALTPFMFVEERYAFVSLPSWLILTAIGIDALFSRLKNVQTYLAVGVLGVLLADAMGANLMYFHTNHGNRWDWRYAFQLVQANMQEGDIVVSTFTEVGDYYLQRDDVVLWEDMNAEKVMDSGQRTWFVVVPDMAWYTGTEELYYWVVHYSRMIKTIYARTVDNTNLEIYLYDPVVGSQLIPLQDP